MIQKMLTHPKKKTTLRELQQLCGFLNFIGKAIVPGRAFTRRLYAHGENTRKPHHHLSVTKEIRLDLELWLRFLENEEVYSRPFFEFDSDLTFTPVEFCTDASRNKLLGCGGICGQDWFILQWNKKFIADNQPSIAYLELYGLTVGILSWLQKYQNKRICVFCDNKSVVAMVNKTTSKCKNCMVLIRIIVMHCLNHNVKLKVAYIESKRNCYADHLSRLRYRQFRQLARKERRIFAKEPTPIPEILHPWKNCG